MKILFTRNTTYQDYLSDCILHGLRGLAEIEVIDEPYCWYMYKSFFEKGDVDLSSIYGKGFTIFGTLNDIEVDRSDIIQKIRQKYFDYVILARVDELPSFAQEIFDHYESKKIIILDGLDHTGINQDYYGKGLYFKRELIWDNSKLFPISFGFPSEKIQPWVQKTQLLAQYTPNNNQKYIYSNEHDYYYDYNKSYFGKTFKKAGFDCLRHYEILGSNSVPYFIDIEHCPERTCTNLPKTLLKVIKDLIETKSILYFLTNEGTEVYNVLKDNILKHFKNNATTVQVAKKMLDKIKEHQ